MTSDGPAGDPAATVSTLASGSATSTSGWIGKRLGQFRIEAQLGRGGMGVVYRAIDERLDRAVALKLLEVAGADGERRKRFLREAKVAATVNHPNIATIYEVGEVDGQLFIAMELVDGKSLRQLLGERQLTIDEVLAIARQILAALARAHEAGIAHRDLKPDNVMIASDGTAKVLDFGLARHDRDAALVDADTVTQTGLLRGTPSYMSPEQARGADADRRSDVFSFGVMLYEMIAGVRPFTGATVADVISSILRDEPAPIAEQNPATPAAIAQVIARCLAKEPDQRFADGASLLAAMPVASIDRALPPTTVERRRPRRWWIAVAVALVVATAGGVLWLVRDRGAATTRGIAITDIPPPASSSKEALAAYAAALQSFRNSHWAAAKQDLERAVQLDPSFAAAYLRLALAAGDVQDPASTIAAHYTKALRFRDRLDARDRALLEAIEPVCNRTPPDRHEGVRRLQAVAARFPRDAEVHGLLAVFGFGSDGEVALRAAHRAVELDPAYADP